MLRPYRPEDLPALTRFIGECFRRDYPSNRHPGDFVHSMSNTHRGKRLEHVFRLAEERGRILAVVELNAESGSYAQVLDARRRGGDWELEFHRACIALMRERMREEADPTITVNLKADDEASGACLERLGFRPRKADHVVMKRSLEGVPDVRLPEGFAIRCVAGAHEAPLVADVHNGAFGSKWSGADYLEVMRTPGYDPERELVVVAPDGRFAAFVVIWFDPMGRSGLFEPVGGHRDFRRRGLTRALMFAGMARMKAAGMQTAIVGHKSGNGAAAALYRSAGFEPWFDTLDYRLEPQRM